MSDTAAAVAGQRCVGVDVGGTFTDFVVASGRSLTVEKIVSTPDDPSSAVLEGLVRLDPGARLIVSHGTTVATNALLEGGGARTALITTRGFRDLLAIGRGDRADLYALEPLPRPVLVPRERTFEVGERVDAAGRVVSPLDPEACETVVRRVERSGAQAVAVCLLFSYLLPDHERQIGRRLAGARGPLYVSLSVDVLPEVREYERASTVAVNAYVGPVVSRYVDRLAMASAPRRLVVMGSHAGVLTPDVAARLPVATVLSGPAAGVIGARAVAERAGRHQIITLDMGGTSTDVALCDGCLPFALESTVAGYPVRRPSVDVHTIGAGGGSFVWIDDGGALRVGPASAGAAPGPAAYGRGGTRPTVTDASVVLGRLPSRLSLAAGVTLDRDAARTAMRSAAASLGVSVEEAALGAVQVVNSSMERAVRRVSVERGHSPAAYTLVAFGGAGPLHACALADQLGMTQVLVPVAAGALSALGLATAPPAADASRSVLRPADVPPSDHEAVFRELEALAMRALAGVDGVRLERSADVRYAGQSWELNVPWHASGEALADAFAAAHAARYGYARPGVPIEIVTLRARGTGRALADMPPPPPLRPAEPFPAPLRLDDGQSVSVPVIDRWSLPPGARVDGPAIVSQEDATSFVADGWVAEVGPWGDLMLSRAPAAGRPTAIGQAAAAPL